MSCTRMIPCGACISVVPMVMEPASVTPGRRATISRTSPGMRDDSANGPRVPASTTQRSARRLRDKASASATTPW